LKPRVANYLNLISNNSWFSFTDVVLDKSKIHESDLNYFLSSPEPLPFIGDINSYIKYLSRNKIILELEARVDIKF
jgi:hypothetical protein